MRPAMQPVQMKMAMAALDLDLDGLASKAGIARSDLAPLLAGGTANSEYEHKLQALFELGGIEFIGDDGVRLADTTTGDDAIAVESMSSYNDR